MKNVLFPLSLLILAACQPNNPNQIDTQYAEGWNILSNNDEMAEMVIERAAENGINHLQLSHSIVMDLKDVKKSGGLDFPEYTNSTFERIPFQGFSGEKKQEILKEYQSFR
ncbi:MAG: hypothetical protein ACOC2F_04630 [Bacteroidota bacterium]